MSNLWTIAKEHLDLARRLFDLLEESKLGVEDDGTVPAGRLLSSMLLVSCWLALVQGLSLQSLLGLLPSVYAAATQTKPPTGGQYGNTH